MIDPFPDSEPGVLRQADLLEDLSARIKSQRSGEINRGSWSPIVDPADAPVKLVEAAEAGPDSLTLNQIFEAYSLLLEGWQPDSAASCDVVLPLLKRLTWAAAHVYPVMAGQLLETALALPPGGHPEDVPRLAAGKLRTKVIGDLGALAEYAEDLGEWIDDALAQKAESPVFGVPVIRDSDDARVLRAVAGMGPLPRRLRTLAELLADADTDPEAVLRAVDLARAFKRSKRNLDGQIGEVAEQSLEALPEHRRPRFVMDAVQGVLEVRAVRSSTAERSNSASQSPDRPLRSGPSNGPGAGKTPSSGP